MSGRRRRGQRRWFVAALLPVGIGMLWLVLGWRAGIVPAVLASAPGVVMTATGLALLLWPGDRQISHHMALSSLASLPLALLLSPWLGAIGMLALLFGSLGVLVVAGLAALFQNPVPRDVAEPVAGLRLALKVAADEALLGWFIGCARVPRGDVLARDVREFEALATAAATRSGHDAQQALHAPPEAPRNIRLQCSRAYGMRFEWLSFDSGFVPDPGLPGAARWHGYEANQRMAARVIRHPGAPRPWLLCIHGYRMGLSRLDLSLFDADWLHHGLGLNLIMPILPLHGPRRARRLSGGLFLDGPLVDLLHAESQALWDLRRCLAWVRAQQPGEDIGVLGYSLGGYNAALLAAFEPALACVIAGVPLTDIPASLWRQMPTMQRRFIESQGIEQALASRLLAPVSPLHLTPAVAAHRRYIFAATGDQLVSPDQPLRLWRHWGEPAIHWYHGSHLSVRREAALRPFVAAALRDTGLVASDRQ